ncbi:MAG: trypsin-like peptidase domain-containing protein [Caldimonas sp.]
MTSRRLGARIACALGLGGAAVGAAALTPAEVYALVSPSVWRVVTYDVDGLQLAQGSAVVVGPEALATNCHVLAKAKRVVVRHEKASFDARLELWDTARDLCQLRAPGLPAPPVRLAPTAGVVVGATVYAIGTPRGLELTMSAGLVSSLRRNAAGQVVLVQTSASISRGSSGGGLFDDTGALVGLTTIGSITGDAQNLNFAIPADWIAALPERHARLSKKAASSPGPADAASASAPSPGR